ncbi:MAG: rRNA maturation RNase YbeY [Epulopiscium sp.]|nr:rRNA maturation RNase YbeY [Candidatus Epulonipiscium sp.]
MTIWIENNTMMELPKGMEEQIENIVKTSLEQEEYPLSTEVSITFVDNQEIHELNKQHRGIDNPTDVLSFPMLDFADQTKNIDSLVSFSECFNLDTKELILGDIIISLEKAKEQSELYGHSLEREIGFLVAHSMFHLMGYDHMTENEEKVMNEKQELILEKVGLVR